LIGATTQADPEAQVAGAAADTHRAPEGAAAEVVAEAGWQVADYAEYHRHE